MSVEGAQSPLPVSSSHLLTGPQSSEVIKRESTVDMKGGAESDGEEKKDEEKPVRDSPTLAQQQVRA